jgi:hypothetical protein
MYEFDSVSVSSYEAASLAAKLTEKSGDGWDVVSIIPAGSEITAFLRREKSGAPAERTAEPTTDYAASSTSSWESSSASAESPASAVSEPAGWGSAPESTTTPTATVPTQAATTTPTATQPATPAVPAGWYSDPARRYDLRYWDGNAWTEHVSRAGQQYTDPPVA